MFEIHIGTTPCELTPKDYRTLAIRSERYVCGTYATTSRQLSPTS
jgi:vacuolar protein-sorting-associated protein 4